MKNKKLLYVLTPLALVVWGLIIYRIFAGLGPERPERETDARAVHPKTGKMDRDTFVLHCDYRDPFLKGGQQLHSLADGTDELLSGRNALPAAGRPVETVPDLKYFGVIVNAQKKCRTGLFRFDGKNFNAREGETVAPFRIMKLQADSVIVWVNKKKRTYKKMKL